MQEEYRILIVSDSGFEQHVKDEHKSRKKLYDFLERKNEGRVIELMTCSGKYSFGDGIRELKVNDKNKTSFVRSLEYYLNRIDEAVIITNYENENFLSALRNKLTELYITTSIFGYEVKQNGQEETSTN